MEVINLALNNGRKVDPPPTLSFILGELIICYECIWYKHPLFSNKILFWKIILEKYLHILKSVDDYFLEILSQQPTWKPYYPLKYNLKLVADNNNNNVTILRDLIQQYYEKSKQTVIAQINNPR